MKLANCTCPAIAVGLVLVLATACKSDSSTDGHVTDAASSDSRSVPDANTINGTDTRGSQPDAKIYSPNSRKCSLMFNDPTDCNCNDGTPGASDPPACSTDSVVTASTDLGVCCEDAFGCECIGYACSRGGNPSTCACARIGDPDLPSGGTAVSECTAANSTQKCCYSAALKSCRCTSFGCSGSYDVEVANCNLAKVAVCASGATSLTNCK
jgi:hypothetical protein